MTAIVTASIAFDLISPIQAATKAKSEIKIDGCLANYDTENYCSAKNIKAFTHAMNTQ